MTIRANVPDLDEHAHSLTTQSWNDLCFMHWPVDPAAVAALLPPGTQPDELDGTTYVGLVPFQMRGAGPGRLPVPYFGQFCETNVRLYSVDYQGRHGIVFLTLDAARLATVLLARLGLGLPYAWSAMSISRSADVVTYRSTRRWPNRATRAGGIIEIRIGERVEATDVEAWLTLRWGLHTCVAGRTIWIPNRHAPWTLRAADLLTSTCDLVARCGVDVSPTDMLRPLWSPGVTTTFGRPVLVQR